MNAENEFVGCIHVDLRDKETTILNILGTEILE